jgi:hypothetical protein
MSFNVRIKEETFDMPNLSFLHGTSFSPEKVYRCVGVIDSKLLIADGETGSFVELFPRNCLFVGE